MAFIALSSSALQTLREMYPEQSRQCIYLALHYKRASMLARLIRSDALKLGGKIVKD